MHNAKLLDGRKRQAIITALANGESKRSIVRRLRVGNHTVDAVAEQEWQQVAARKERLLAQWERAATKAVDQINDHLESKQLPANILVPIAGTATDKILALRGDPLLTIRHEQEPYVHIDLFKSFQEAVAKLPKRAQIVESSSTQATHCRTAKVSPDSGVETGLIKPTETP